VLPFEVIYLHDGRGFALGTAGLVVGTLTGLAVVSAPCAGPLIDRFGARVVAAGAGIALAAGYAGLALATGETMAFVAAAGGGAGNGALLPAQSTLLASLAERDVRHRAGAVSRVCTNAGFGLGGALGGLVASFGLTGLVSLFLLNALTYLAYVCVLVCVVPFASVFARLRRLPAAKGELDVGPGLIGLLLLANAATVAVAQVPIARVAEGRRRVATMAVGSGLIAGACLLVLSARILGGAAYGALVVAVVVVGVGVLPHGGADAARCRPRTREAPRPLHGDDGAVLVGRPHPRTDTRDTPARHLFEPDVHDLRARRSGRLAARTRSVAAGRRAADSAAVGWLKLDSSTRRPRGISRGSPRD
jgi:MFS family permease